MQVMPIGDLNGLMPSAIPDTKPVSGAKSFAAILEGFVEDTNRQQIQADQAVQQLATGESDSIPDTMLALSKADLSLRVFMEVRNKVIEAYQEVMRMQM